MFYQRNVNNDHTCHSTCDHSCDKSPGSIRDLRRQYKEQEDRTGAQTYTAEGNRVYSDDCDEGVIISAHDGQHTKMADVKNFHCFVNEGDKCQCNCHEDEN